MAEIGNEKNGQKPILYCNVGEPVVVTFEPSVTDALQEVGSVDAFTFVAVRVRDEFTVMELVALPIPQLLVTEYEITAVPGTTPVTLPELFTVATDVLLLVHEPPPDPPLRVRFTEDPVHTEDGPLIVPVLAARLTAITLVELNVPQPLERV